jgi:hypothetical protein
MLNRLQTASCTIQLLPTLPATMDSFLVSQAQLVHLLPHMRLYGTLGHFVLCPLQYILQSDLKDIQDLKSEFRNTVGLSKHSGRHKDPHEKPEFKTLLREYRNAEIHLRRLGRTIGSETPIGVETRSDKTHKNQDVNNMLKGIKSLVNGGLKKWTTKTTKSRGLREGGLETSAAGNEEANADGSDSEDDMWEHDSDHEPEVSGGQLTFGIMHAKDGELVIEYEGEDDYFEENIQ